MSVAQCQAEQVLHGGSTDGGEVDLGTLFQGHLIDWDILDDVSLEELSNLAESWNNTMVDVATDAPEAMILPSPSDSAAATPDKQPEADNDGSEPLGTPNPTVSLLPNLEPYAVEEPWMPTKNLSDLDFSNFDFSESSANDPFIVENVNGTTILNEFNSSSGSPKEPTHAIATNGLFSETHYADPVKPSQTKSIHLAKMNPNFKVSINYTPLLTKPRTWHIFTYTKHGELNPGNLFTAADIQHYLWRHPLHEASHNRRSSPLTLRIHRNPPASQDRYPANHGSHRCRFHECPADNNTIDKGQFVVMFDELSAIHPNHDPYLTAGYVHLYCLERFLDFPKICATLNVQTEKRRLDKETKNMMRLDPKQVEAEADSFIETCREPGRRRPDGYPSYKERGEVTGRPYEGTLTHRMHLAKLTNRSGSINKQEAARERAAGQKGGSLGSHLGDLVLATALRQSTRKHTRQNQLVANPRQKRKFKGDGVVDAGENESDDLEPIQSKRDDRLQQLRRPLPPLITSTAYMPPSTAQQLGGYSLLPTSGNNAPALAPRYPQYQLDENRKFILPTGGLHSPDPPLKPQQHCQPQQHHQPSNARFNASVPAPQAEHQKHRGPDTSRQSKRRSSDEAGNDEAANLSEDPIARLFSQNSLDAGLRPVKKVKNSQTSVPSSLAQTQAHQRQVLSKKHKARPVLPPPTRPQALQVGHKRRGNEAGILQSQFHPQKLPLPIAQRKRTSNEAGLVFDKDVFEVPAKRPRISEPDFHSRNAENQRALSSGMIPPVRQSSGQRSEEWLHASAQHHPHNLQEGHYPTQRPLQGYQPQQASDTLEARRQIMENYDRYTRQNSRRKTGKSSEPRKRPARALGNDGKVIRHKQRTVTKTPGMVFGGLGHKVLLQEQQKLLAEAELRADEERATRQMEAIEQEEAIQQEEAKLRAEDEQFARQREQKQREERER